MGWDYILAGFEPVIAATLFGTSFLGSFLTVAMGIGGGSLVLAVMAALMPPAALIPVHGVIQLGSNILRAGLLLNHTHWPPVGAFVLGTLVGALVGGSLVVNLPPGAVLMGVGLFILWSVLSRPPAWLSRVPGITGFIASFLSMFFGATGVFVANYIKALDLPRQSHVATQAVLMTAQHAMKVVVFGMLGFAFGPWIGFLCGMIAAGFLGTLAGRLVLIRMSDQIFRRVLNTVLVLIALRLIWQGANTIGG